MLAKAGGRRGGSQVAAGLDGGRGFPFFGLKQPPAGTPKELLKVERLNDRWSPTHFSATAGLGLAGFEYSWGLWVGLIKHLSLPLVPRGLIKQHGFFHLSVFIFKGNELVICRKRN